MNILMIFRNNPLKTSGAVSLDLFNDFRKRGHQVKLLVNQYAPDYPDGIISMETWFLHWKKRMIAKVKRVLRLKAVNKTDKKYHFHETNMKRTFYRTNKILRKSFEKPDVIIVLFANDFVNAKNIFELNKKSGAPVFLMMYDTAPLTGGCHYSWDCNGYQESCGNCPGLFSHDPFDLTNQNLLYKKKYLSKTDIHIVLASEWQYQQATKSSVFKDHPIHKILISINPEIFKPVAKDLLRKNMGIDPGKKVIFFGAKNFQDERKGSIYLLEALKILKNMVQENPDLNNNIVLLVAGEEKNMAENEFLFELIDLGMLDNSYGIAAAYQVADLFLCPSIEDAGPSMVNQSIMCGTPVVSFYQGVSMDLVKNGKTGYCARLKDSHDLALGLYSILMMPDRELAEMQNNCRQMALDLFHPDVSINHWLKIISAY